MNNKFKGNNNQKHDPPSNILLVIITQIPPQIPLTNESLHQSFSPFGNVQKILIFERGKVNKAFVQFQELKEAILARSRLNLTYLYKQVGKLHIHYSKLQNLDLQVVQHTRGIDFKHSKYHDDFIINPSNSLTLLSDVPQGQRASRIETNDHPIQYSKTDEPRTLNTQLMELRLGEFSLKDVVNESSPTDIHQQNDFGEELNQEMILSVQKLLEDDFQSIKEQDSKISYNSQDRQGPSSRGNQDNRNDEINNLLNDDCSSHEIKSTVSPSPLVQKILTQMIKVPSNLIKVQGLESPLINVQILFNMFSIFGNISLVLYKNIEQSAFISYQNEEFASIAKECMNNMIFFEKRLRIIFCQNIEKIQGTSINEVLIIPESNYSFLGLKNVNFPSKILKICNINIISHKSLSQLIKKQANVEIINIKSNDMEKNSFLVTTNTIEDSFKIISYLNNSYVIDTKTKVQFLQDE